MATMVGTQKDFKDALMELIELEYDAIEAYKVAIEKLDNSNYRTKLQEFLGDHHQHVNELSALLQNKGHQAPNSPSIKQWLTKGKVALGNLFSDETIISAMVTNEEDMVDAYTRMSKHETKWPEASNIIAKALQDEQRHKAWMENSKDKADAA